MHSVQIGLSDWIPSPYVMFCHDRPFVLCIVSGDQALWRTSFCISVRAFYVYVRNTSPESLRQRPASARHRISQTTDGPFVLSLYPSHCVHLYPGGSVLHPCCGIRSQMLSSISFSISLVLWYSCHIIS